MSYTISLSSQIDVKERKKDSIIVDSLMLYEGHHVDSAGVEVEVSRELLSSLDAGYRNMLDENHHALDTVKELFGKTPNKPFKKVILNHDKYDVRQIVGKILETKVVDRNGIGYLFGKLEIHKPDNIYMVENNLWNDMSISFDYDYDTKSGELLEISYVFSPAVKKASSFSQNETSLTNSKSSVELQQHRHELSEKRIELAQTRKAKVDLERQMLQLEGKIKAFKSFNQLVRDGLISRADHKRLMFDMQGIDPSNVDAMTRAINTVAHTRKHLRGKITSNFSSHVFESFVDNVINPTHRGDKMESKKIDFDALASNIVSAVKGENTDAKTVPSDFNAAEGLTPGAGQVEGHTEEDHTIRFKPDDMCRLNEMVANKSSHEEIGEFLKSVSGGANLSDKPEAEAPKESAEYQALKSQFVNLQENLSKTNSLLERQEETINKLTDKLVELSAKTAQ